MIEFGEMIWNVSDAGRYGNYTSDHSYSLNELDGNRMVEAHKIFIRPAHNELF